MLRHRRAGRDPASAAISRRDFFALAVAATAAACGGGSSEGPASPSSTVTGRLSARPEAQRTTLSPGAHVLGRDVGRDDGIIYVPHGVDPAQPLPFAVMMHGGGGNSMGMDFTLPLAEEYGVVLLLPQSRKGVWDAVVGSFGADVTFIDGALAQVFSGCAIDPARVTLGGLSDGGTYALALGLLNGDLFTRLVAFSAGFLKPVDRNGRPRVFVSHGTGDRTFPIYKGRAIVQQLRDEGYDVTYLEFDGGHEVPDTIAHEAFAWLS
jgi:phospholipase/carboxylesterase